MDGEFEIEHAKSKTDTRTPAASLGEQQLRDLLAEAISPDLGLSPLKGFRMDLPVSQGCRKVYFSTRCQCGTAALLSVEVAEDKTSDEVRHALPSLVSKLEQQSRSFSSTPCDVHRKMRIGPVAYRQETAWWPIR